MPYEKRILDMIKSGGSSAEKRIYKFSKKRVSGLGTCVCVNVQMLMCFCVLSDVNSWERTDVLFKSEKK